MHFYYRYKKKNKAYILLVWVLGTLLYCNKATAQIPGLHKYTQLDGYSATIGYEIEQDEKGYIWLGTDNGGMSFDGKTFRPAQDTRSSPNAEILFCRPLGRSRILLLPLCSKISYLDKGNLVTAEQDTNLRNISMAHHYCIKDPVTGKWWLGDYGKSAVLYSFIGKEIRGYDIKQDSFSYVQIINNKLIGQKCIDLYGNGSLCIFDMNSRTLQYFQDSSGTRMRSGPENFIYTGPNADYLLTGLQKHYKLYRYNAANNVLTWVRNLEAPAQIGLWTTKGLLLDANHDLWMKADQGLVYYSNIINTRNKLSPYYFPEPSLINSVFVDRNNNVWLSSPNNVLYFLSEKHLKNELLANRFPHRQWIPKAISGDGKGKMFFSYVNHSEVSYIQADGIKDIELGPLFREGSRRISQLDKNRFILYDGDIVLVNTRTGAVKYLNTPGAYKDISVIGDSALITAEALGVYYISAIVRGKVKRELLFGKRATAVEAFVDKHVLIGTMEGLYIKKDLSAPAIKINHPVLSENYITDILSINDKGAFIGTNTRGLFMMTGPGEEIRSVKLSESNNPGHIRRLYRQNDSTYWIATNNGAYALVFDKNWSLTGTKNYTFYDGLPSNNVTDIYVYSDTAYFATTQGLGIMPLKDSSRLQMAPPGVYINALQTDDTVFYEPDSTILLSHGQNNILISLSAISYESLGNTGYYYQLYPLHDKWIQTTNPEVRFTGLPPGKYTFRAYALNAKNIKSEWPVILTFEIKPAFWQTVYFLIALSVFVCILLYMVVRWNMQQGEKKRFEVLQQKKRLAELELEAIKAQINPHFIYNCLNSIKYLNYTGAYKQTQEYLSIFAKLIRMTMQYSRRAFITLNEEVEYLSSYLQLEKLRFKEKLQYAIHIESEINRDSLLPAMLLQPYVENALKHGIGSKNEGGEVSIEFLTINGNLEVLIKDNGPGFSKPETSDTLGLHLSQTRAVSYNELFNLNIIVQYYNEQDRRPGRTGAVVRIIFNTIAYGPIIQ